MPESVGWRRQLHLREEVTWGIKSTTNIDVPVPFVEYSVRPRIDARRADVFVGLRQRKHGAMHRSMPAGRLVAPLLSVHAGDLSIAQRMLEWSIGGPATPFVPSYTAELGEPDIGDIRHLGLRVASVLLSGDAASNVWTISLDLVGKEEVGGIVAPTLSPNTPPPMAFRFSDAALYLSDDPIPIRSLRLRVENNLKRYHVSSVNPSMLAAGPRDVSLQFSVLKKDAAIDEIRRSTEPQYRSCRLVLLGRHLGTAATGEFTKIELHLDRLSFVAVAERTPINDFVTQEASWIALKPDTASNELDVTFSTI